MTSTQTQQDADEEWRRRLSAAIRREDEGSLEEEDDDEPFVLHPLCRAGPLQMTVKPSTSSDDTSTASSSPLGVFPLAGTAPKPPPVVSSITTGLVKKRRSSSSPEDIHREKIPHLLLKKSSGKVVPLARQRGLLTLNTTTSTTSLASRTAPPPTFAGGTDEEYFDKPTTSTSAPTSPLDRVRNIMTARSEEQDLNFAAELFWLKTQLSDHWSMKWLFQVPCYHLSLNSKTPFGSKNRARFTFLKIGPPESARAGKQQFVSCQQPS